MVNDDRRDIVLLLGSGGMMGIFTAGVLEVVYEQFRDRIHSIYATSSGADVAVYLVSGQPYVPRRFFLTHLTHDGFIRNNWITYLCKIFFSRNSARIPDFINIDHVIDVAQHSECALDVAAFERSPIDLFVKVINMRTRDAEYLPARTQLFEKLKATSQCGPFSSHPVVIDGTAYIDGDTISSRADRDVVERFQKKTIIYVEPVGPELRWKILLFPLYVLAGLAIMRLFGIRLGARYINELLHDPAEDVRHEPNVVYIKNHLSASIFCTDVSRLERIHAHGKEEAKRICARTPQFHCAPLASEPRHDMARVA